MTREIRILSAGIVLNFGVYLGAASYFAAVNVRMIADQFAQFTMITSRFLVSEQMTAKTLAADMMRDYYTGTRTFKEKILWNSDLFYTLSEVANIVDKTAHYLLQLPIDLAIPRELLNNSPFHFIRYGSDSHLYYSTSIQNVDYGANGETLAPYPHFFTFQVNTSALKAITLKSNLHYTIVEYDESGRSQTLFSNLKKEETAAVLDAAQRIDHTKLDDVGAVALTQTGYKFVVPASLSGTKALIFPLPISSNPRIRQIFYFVMPIPDYRKIDLQSLVLGVLALFTVSFGFLCLGFARD